MLPLRLCSPRSINLCMVSSCGFLWWSPFAELEASLIKPTSLNYKSTQRCSYFFSLSQQDLSSSFLYEKLTPRLAPHNEWELFELLVKIVLQWLPEGEFVMFCCWLQWTILTLHFPAPASHFWSFSLRWKLRRWVHALIPFWRPEPLIPSLLTLPHLSIILWQNSLLTSHLYRNMVFFHDFPSFS